MAGSSTPNTGIHVSPDALPKMDRPSIVLAWFLDSMMVTGIEEVLSLVCTHCAETVCDIEPNDTLRVLFNTALAHTCE